MTARSLRELSPPVEIVDWLRRIERAGHSSRLVGECVVRLALGLPVRHYRAESSISRADLLALAPRSIPTGVDSGVVTVPTKASPLEILPAQQFSSSATRDLGQSFRILTLRHDPLNGQLTGAPSALDDLLAARIAITAQPSGIFHEDNLFTLEAARLIATLGFVPTPEVSEQAQNKPALIEIKKRPRARNLIREILTAPHVGNALSWLRDTGAQELLVRGVRHEAPGIVQRLPDGLFLRMCAWLDGADARSFLRDLHFGGEFSSNLYRFAALHPIDTNLDPSHDVAVNRLLKSVSQSQISDLVALREAAVAELRETGQIEDAEQIALRLKELNEAFTRVRRKRLERKRRAELALSGDRVMELLGCEPGPVIGKAIRYLEQCVANDPSTNNAETLATRLEDFRVSEGLR